MNAEFKAELERYLIERRDELLEESLPPWIVPVFFEDYRRGYCISYARTFQECRRRVILMLGCLGKTDESFRKLSEELYEAEMSRPPELM